MRLDDTVNSFPTSRVGFRNTGLILSCAPVLVALLIAIYSGCAAPPPDAPALPPHSMR